MIRILVISEKSEVASALCSGLQRLLTDIHGVKVVEALAAAGPRQAHNFATEAEKRDCAPALAILPDRFATDIVRSDSSDHAPVSLGLPQHRWNGASREHVRSCAPAHFTLAEELSRLGFETLLLTSDASPNGISGSKGTFYTNGNEAMSSTALEALAVDIVMKMPEIMR